MLPITDILFSPALLTILLPLAGAVLALGYSKMPRSRANAFQGVVIGTTLLLAAKLVSDAPAGVSPQMRLFRVAPDLYLSLRVDAAGALFGLTIAALWFATFVFAVGYLRDDPRAGRYHTFSMLCFAGLMGVAYAGDFFTLLALYELFSILSYALIVHEGTAKAVAAGRKYIVYIVSGGSLLVMGAALTFTLAGTLGFEPGGILPPDAAPASVALAALLLIAGFGVKAALVPLHGWVVDAHPAAPAPFSAALSGVMVAAGAFAIVRVVYEIVGPGWLAALGMDRWLAALAAFTVISAAVIAIRQDDLKRRLAYSTISQMAYVTLGAFLLGAGALTGALVHITNHAFMKGALFLCAGVLARDAGVQRVSQMHGIARRYPVTMAVFAIAALGMIGTPPLSGFISKWVLGRGMFDAGAGGYLFVLVGGAALAAVYLLPVLSVAYLGEQEGGGESEPVRSGPRAWREASPYLLVPLIALTVITVLLGSAAFMDVSALSLARMAAGLLATGG